MDDQNPLPPGAQEWGTKGLLAQWAERRRRQHEAAMIPSGSGAVAFGFDTTGVGFVGLPPTVKIDLPELVAGVELVLRGTRTDEGVIIEAVSPIWRRFLDELSRDPQAFSQLTPEQMEELVAGA